MKLIVPLPVEMEAKLIRMELPIDYPLDELEIPEDLPGLTVHNPPIGRYRDQVATLNWTLDLDSRKLVGWPEGRELFTLYLKVADSGRYFLLDGNGQVIGTREGYVPRCVPSEFSDYVSIKIAPNGSVLSDSGRPWDPIPSLVVEEFWPETIR